MAGDEPSEDAEAGADGDEAADGDPGGDPASDEPTAGDAPEDTSPTDEPTHDSRDPVDDQGSGAADATDAAGEPDAGDEADADESGEPTDDETTDGETTDDEAVEAEAEALVEEMEAAVAEADASASGDDDAEPPPDDEQRIFPAGGVPREGRDTERKPPGDEEVPIAPDSASDTEIDAPGDDGEPIDHAGPVVDDVDEPDELDEPDVSEGVFGGARSGPAEDREMPLADHIREMLRRLAVVVAIAGFVSLLVFPFAEEIVNFLWYSILPGVESDIARPRLYGVLELVFTELKVASLAGLIVALPVMVYETYAFMRPGLYPHERRYYLAAIPTSLVLAIVGVAFAYFVVLPSIFVYFLYYSQDVATIGFALGRTFDLILLMMAYLAVVFQIPLFIMLAMMMGLVTRRWLAERRLLFWGAFLGVSFLFSFDPTGMAPIIVAATMIVLFEGTLLLTKWTGRE